MLQFSFIDFGNRDFIRNHADLVLVMEFPSWEDADEYIQDGNLEQFGWTNQDTRKFCWNEDDE